LPESTVSFSRVNLPSTNMLVKSNLALNFLSYWRLLNSKTNVNTDPITDKPYVFDDTYLNGIREYLPSEDRNGKQTYERSSLYKCRFRLS
jgi:hypothetical protein